MKTAKAKASASATVIVSKKVYDELMEYRHYYDIKSKRLVELVYQVELQKHQIEQLEQEAEVVEQQREEIESLRAEIQNLQCPADLGGTKADCGGYSCGECQVYHEQPKEVAYA